MKRIKPNLSIGRKWQRAIAKVTKEYHEKMIARAVYEIMQLRSNAPKLSEIAEAIDFPTGEQVIRRWNRVKNKLKVKNPSAWTPTSIPNFSYYKASIISREDEQYFADILFGLKKEAYLESAAKAAATIGREAWIGPQTLETIRNKTIKIVTTDITPTLKNKLVEKIERAINAGFTIDETAHDLGLLNTNWRTIAKTETFDVLNMSSRDQVMKEVEEYGGEPYKYWQHSGNANGRPSHILAGETYSEANAIPMDEPFIVDGESLQYPHDPSGSAGNNVNCGCIAVYILK